MPKKVAILVHGLNNPVSILENYRRELNAQGYECIQPVLAGHTDKPSCRLLHKKWIGQIKSYYDEHCKDADETIFVGFSLGGVSGVAGSQCHDIIWDKMILIAPAIRMTTWIQLLTPIHFLHIIPFPTYDPKKRLLFKYLFVSYIRSLQKLEKLLTPGKKVAKELILVITNKDEVVNIKHTREFCSDISDVFMDYQVKSKKRNRIDLYHLVNDEEGVYPEEWEEILKKIGS